MKVNKNGVCITELDNVIVLDYYIGDGESTSIYIPLNNKEYIKYISKYILSKTKKSKKQKKEILDDIENGLKYFNFNNIDIYDLWEIEEEKEIVFDI
jgi:hypothetical protein